ncbi:MAG: hypothetical protein FWE67_04120 [Planctomycetaceae bacterium]|nr:hypothetical protein [Planctomycetaceae bacterium]
MNRFALILLPVMICVLLLTGCAGTKGNTKNKYAFPSMPKWEAKEKKPKKDPYAPKTVEQFLAAERPSFYN